MNIVQLDQALKKVCPVDGVSIGSKSDPSSWRIFFRPEATEQQRDDALAILAEQKSIESGA